ncbi:MAG: hypothetical protein LBJ71_03400 [Holosporaceae bacterium]|jgi:hypothetical protein|nr:hypothetical protein [Holosporaceae bacterium]
MIIAILYYLHDIPKYKRMQTQMDFCAHCGVSMFQNISAGRTNKRIRVQDLKYISCITFHPYFVGTKHYSVGDNWSSTKCFGHVLLCYVKGVGENRAVMKWWFLNNWGSAPPTRALTSAKSGHTYTLTILNGNIGTEYDASYIHKDLKIKNGEVKMIFEVMLYPDGNPKPADFWGFYVFVPKRDSKILGYFHSVVIFTPNSGLFSEGGID